MAEFERDHIRDKTLEAVLSQCRADAGSYPSCSYRHPLFDAVASTEKTLRANPGEHGDLPRFEMDDSLHFFARQSALTRLWSTPPASAYEWIVTRA